MRYRKLLIATGGVPKRLDVTGAALNGIYCLHIVVGASFVGLEAAEWLVNRQIQVTIVEQGKRVFAPLHAQPLSDFFGQFCEARGVEVRLDTSVARFEGNRAVERVVTTAGEHIECDLVILAVGISPRTEFLAGSGIAH